MPARLRDVLHAQPDGAALEQHLRAPRSRELPAPRGLVLAAAFLKVFDRISDSNPAGQVIRYARVFFELLQRFVEERAACAAKLVPAAGRRGAGRGAAGCGGSGTRSKDEHAAGRAAGPGQGKLTISQWPLYIDPGKNGTDRPVRARHRRRRQIHRGHQRQRRVLRQDAAAARQRGSSGGRDLITVSDWLAARMYELGYLQKFDYSQLPNVKKNLIPRSGTRRPTRSATSRFPGRAA